MVAHMPISAVLFRPVAIIRCISPQSTLNVMFFNVTSLSFLDLTVTRSSKQR